MDFVLGNQLNQSTLLNGLKQPQHNVERIRLATLELSVPLSLHHSVFLVKIDHKTFYFQ